MFNKSRFFFNEILKIWADRGRWKIRDIQNSPESP
jgi:hypothetical protein